VTLRLVLWLLLLAGAAPAAGTRDLADAWLTSGPRSARLVTAPTGDWWLAAAHGRLFGMPELPQLGLLAACRRPRWRVELAWERLGSDLYREDRLRGRWTVGARWRLGLAGSVDRLLLAGQPRSGASAALVVAGPLGARCRWSLDWSLLPAPEWYGERGLRRWLRLEYDGAEASTTVALDRRVNATPVVQAEALIRLTSGVAWGLRYDGGGGAVGLVTVWCRSGLTLRSSHLAHPDLGLTHRWTLAVSP